MACEIQLGAGFGARHGVMIYLSAAGGLQERFGGICLVRVVAGGIVRGMGMRWRTWLPGVLAVVVAAVAAGFAGLVWWFPKNWRAVLVTEVPMERADAIIVLGGESSGRPEVAARLWRAGVAERVFVVGTGDASSNIGTLVERGVPAGRIVVERRSRSTLENAEFARPLLEEAGVESAVLVTSSFHARRALATFQQRVPGVEFGMVTSRIAWWDTPEGAPQEEQWARVELKKLFAYWLLHGIVPFVNLESPSTPARQP